MILFLLIFRSLGSQVHSTPKKSTLNEETGIGGKGGKGKGGKGKGGKGNGGNSKGKGGKEGALATDTDEDDGFDTTSEASPRVGVSWHLPLSGIVDGR